MAAEDVKPIVINIIDSENEDDDVEIVDRPEIVVKYECCDDNDIEIKIEGDNNSVGNSSKDQGISGDGETLLNILLKNPAEMCLNKKPSGVREDSVFTLNSKHIPIESMKADDNGPYDYKGTTTKFFYFDKKDNGLVCMVHKYDDEQYYFNEKSGKRYIKTFVSSRDVYALTRRYRESKFNPGFRNTIVTARQVRKDTALDHYIVIYKWTHPPAEEDFIMPRHGNSTNPCTSAYYRQDPSVHNTIDSMIEEGLSNEKIYSVLTRENPQTVSETVRSPTVIKNRKFEKNCENIHQEENKSKCSEVISIIKYVKENEFVKSVAFTPSEYSTLNYLPQMMKDIERFCVKGNAILSVDTTFEICDGLWLTDTSYTNLSLIKAEDGEYAEFPGPSFWHFRKDRKAFRRFAAELVVENPELVNIKKIGHDLDKAQMRGFRDIFTTAISAWCTKHISGRDAEQLRSMSAGGRDKNRILADIYGTQSDILLQNGLADSLDDQDFITKLESLEEVWEPIVPGFHKWFKKNRREIFLECLTLSARKDLGIGEKRFYTNSLENKHKLQKKKLSEEGIQKEVIEVSKALQDWAKQYFVESELAIRGLGRYRLSEEYADFYRKPIHWNQMQPKSQEEVLKNFYKYTPDETVYKKPCSSGLKSSSGKNKRRVNLQEPDIFEDRVAVPNSPKHVRIDHQQSSASGQDESVQGENVPDENIQEENIQDEHDADMLFDPDRVDLSMYELVHRNDKKSCPKMVKKCFSCNRMYTDEDIVVIKTHGERGYHCQKSGKEKVKNGNIYLHFLTRCMLKYDKNFKIKNVRVPRVTADLLPKTVLASYKNKGMKILQ